MNSSKKIPRLVESRTRPFVKNNGAEVRPLGIIDGLNAFALVFPDDVEVGYPSVFLCRGEDVVSVLSGTDALSCIRSFSPEN